MSDDDNVVRRLAIEQRKRMLATILGYAESEVFPKLSKREQYELREKVVGAVNTYHDFILDVIKVNREDVVRSEEAVALIRQVHESQARVERSLVVHG